MWVVHLAAYKVTLEYVVKELTLILEINKHRDIGIINFDSFLFPNVIADTTNGF